MSRLRHRLRSILSAVLVLVAVFLVSCSAPEAAAPPKVDPVKLERIQGYVARVGEFEARFSELQSLIAQRKWSDTASLIHGPLGELRRTLSLLARQLEPGPSAQVQSLSKDLFKALVDLDREAGNNNQAAVISAFNRAKASFDQLTSLSF